MASKQTAKLRVLMATAEAVPFAKTGGLGDVAGTLPAALAAAGAEASVIMPAYASIGADLLSGAQLVASFDVEMPAGAKPCKVLCVQHGEVPFFLIENAEYFCRDNLYGYDDDIERFAFFSRCVCRCVAEIPQLACDVVHCNDWQTALVPVYLRTLFADEPACAQVKTVFTIHNAQFQGQGPDWLLPQVVGLGEFAIAGTACTLDDGSVNLMKGALTFADELTTVSPSYAEELTRAEYGERLDPVFRRRRPQLSGVLNGIDLKTWDPANDPFIERAYCADDLSGKAACKKALQVEMGLEVRADRPLVAMVTRLTDQKGVGMVCEQIERLMQRGVQLAILGTGDAGYERALAAAAATHPGQMSVALRFDNALSHRMYAGADLLLMPSMFEPCGLSQMIAMVYGTLPVVRETGGLRDSVEPYNKYTGEGTGFSFANADANEMADILLNACEVFWTDAKAWARLQHQAMTTDFSWTRAATDYLRIYAR